MPKKWMMLVAMLVAACDDAVPMANTAADTTGKGFTAPSPAKASLYIYRPDGAGSVLDTTANQRTLGSLPKRSYLRVDLSPGNWDIRCRSSVTTSSTNSIAAELRPGTITFIEARYSLPATGFCRLQLVDSSHAKQEISGLSRIQEVGGASD